MAAAESADKSKDQQLRELLAAASHDYALKSYDKASDLYAQAAELQDELNGEMNPANAELLYAYGRCLHHLAVSKSDVLGGKVAGPSDGAGPAKKAGKKRKRGDGAVAGSSSAAASTVAAGGAAETQDTVTETVLEQAVEDKDGMRVKEQEKQVRQESKPFFQISGDDDGWEDEDEDAEDAGEDDEDAADDEAEEQEDDFATAFEILDVARVLLQRQIQEFEASRDKGQRVADSGDAISQQIWTARDRLADAHDLQAEISLENERFVDAVNDSRASLELKQQLHDETNGQIAEAHYKLALALECGSVTTPKDKDGMPIEGAPQQVDKAMREEAANEMEAAIRVTRQRLDQETESMKNLAGKELKKKQEERRDVEEIIGDMEIKLEDLRSPFVSMNNSSGPAGAALDNNPLGGILGQMLGESPQALKTRIEEATKGANDLTGMVKHKKKPQPEPQTSINVDGGGKGKGKRKVEDEVSEDELAGNSKRLKSPSN